MDHATARRPLCLLCGTETGEYFLKGYYIQQYEDTAYLQESNTSDATLDTDTFDITVPQWLLQRIYLYGSGSLVGKTGSTAFTTTLTATDTTFTTGFSGGMGVSCASGAVDFDWIDIRTAHTITCTGMTDGHYLRVTDGVTAAEAAASSGTATVDAGAVLFPLTSVAIYTEAAGAGTKVAEILAAALADMGGGDAFAYAADVAGSSYYYFLNQ